MKANYLLEMYPRTIKWRRVERLGVNLLVDETERIKIYEPHPTQEGFHLVFRGNRTVFARLDEAKKHAEKIKKYNYQSNV